jgi:hypothetical protein
LHADYQLSVPNRDLNPPQTLGEFLRQTLESSARDGGAYIQTLGHNLRAEIGGLLDAGAADAGRPLVRTGDFPKDAVLFQEITQWDGTTRPFVTGLVEQLPAGHWLRAVLPPEGFFVTEYGPALVLGLGWREGAHGALHPQAWYDLGQSLELTRLWRRQQVERQEAVDLERRRQAELRELEEVQRRWHQSAEGQRAALEQQMAQSRPGCRPSTPGGDAARPGRVPPTPCPVSPLTSIPDLGG